jgi:hypothetical protein
MKPALGLLLNIPVFSYNTLLPFYGAEVFRPDKIESTSERVA